MDERIARENAERMVAGLSSEMQVAWRKASERVLALLAGADEDEFGLDKLPLVLVGLDVQAADVNGWMAERLNEVEPSFEATEVGLVFDLGRTCYAPMLDALLLGWFLRDGRGDPESEAVAEEFRSRLARVLAQAREAFVDVLPAENVPVDLHEAARLTADELLKGLDVVLKHERLLR